jgi:cysteine desulfurase
LWVRDGVTLDPLLHGGGQEGGVRSGTLSPALCAGFGAAARLLVDRAEQDHAHVARLAARARGLTAAWTLNGSRTIATPVTSTCAAGRRRRPPDLGRARGRLSAGSACASGSGRSSHVLRAIGLTDTQAAPASASASAAIPARRSWWRPSRLINQAAERQLSLAA